MIVGAITILKLNATSQQLTLPSQPLAFFVKNCRAVMLQNFVFLWPLLNAIEILCGILHECETLSDLFGKKHQIPNSNFDLQTYYRCNIASFQVCQFLSLFSALDSLHLQSRSGNFFEGVFIFNSSPQKSGVWPSAPFKLFDGEISSVEKKPNSSKCNGDPWGKYADYRGKLEKIYITLRQIRN